MTGFLVTGSVEESVDGGDASGEAADGPGLSLREAVARADAAPGADVIRFDAQLDGTLTRHVLGEIRASEPLTIEGDGIADISVQGDAAGAELTVIDSAIEGNAATGRVSDGGGSPSTAAISACLA